MWVVGKRDWRILGLAYNQARIGQERDFLCGLVFAQHGLVMRCDLTHDRKRMIRCCSLAAASMRWMV